MQQYCGWCGGEDPGRLEAKEASFWINCLDRYSLPAPDQHQSLTLHRSNRCVGVIILDRLALHEVVERIAQPKLAGEFQDQVDSVDTDIRCLALFLVGRLGAVTSRWVAL